ncbi:hypothetical protein VHEMI07615 [[Torrubiella] hemipterigena]|uniref:Carrier domain-containing protein n=1 Tax=[Torrubiella] hemipterigena TaxID=1531966 RepID=A0A0A1TLY8_9HYPO|nr:hypothetical protein VHEMI07615 [[Torrubiella] hemipterigena]
MSPLFINPIIYRQPSATALVSPDGSSLSYYQLDQLSHILATHLLDAEIQPGTSVLLCFQKPWLASLAMLAVMKLGATAIHMDPIHHDTDTFPLRGVSNGPRDFITLSCKDNEAFAHKLGASKTIVIDTEDLLTRQLAFAKFPSSPPDESTPHSSIFEPSGKLNVIETIQDLGSQISISPLADSSPSASESDTTSTHDDADASSTYIEDPLTHILPFSLLQTNIPQDDVINQASQLLSVDPSSVVDIMPATRLQEGLLALTSVDSAKYIQDFTFEIGSHVHLDKLQAAWREVARTHPILRTRLVSLPILGNHCLFQVVLDEPIIWEVQDTAAEPPTQPLMEMGSRLSTFTVNSQSRQLTWTAHHAVYDGWSMPLLLANVERAYLGEPFVHLQPMSTFMKYLAEQDEDAERQYWKDALSETHGAHFPPNKANKTAQPDQEISLHISDLKWKTTGFTLSSTLRAAWAIAVASATGSDEALFGVTVTGRQAPLDGIDLVEGPTIATVPLRVGLDWDKSIHHLLSAVQLQATEMIPFEQTGLQHIARFTKQTESACNFQSLLVVQPPVSTTHREPEKMFLSEMADESTRGNADSYAIVVECEQQGNELVVRFAFDATLITNSQMTFVGETFEHALRELSCDRTKPLLQTLRDERWDLHRAWEWNETVPEASNRCIHDMIADRVQTNPNAAAVNAWDGDFTYRELDDLSTRLALHISEQGVVGKLIPLLFEKSKWMPIAALAVIKAGAGCIAMDATQPLSRLQSIVSQSQAPLMLISAANMNLADSFAGTSKVTVSSDASWPFTESASHPVISPDDVVYVNFTSGSTGIPKGAVNTHRGFASAIKHQQEYLGYRDTSRVFDFSSYAFDVVWCNMLHSFTSGACLCIPSQQERDNDLSGSLHKYKATSIDLTPTVARMLGKKVLSQLSTLILGGEAVLPEDVNLAGKNTEIVNVYGPAECSATATMQKITSKDISIGTGAGACTWVIDPDTLEPSPIGGIGELWLEGPIVGLGYINNAEKTKEAFVKDPAWLARGIPGRPGRKGVQGRTGTLYRTGDLVYYKDDGTLMFVGRKDFQVKIRGQRLELGEVEQHLLSLLLAELEPRVVAETIQLPGANSKTLISFISLGNKENETEAEHALRVASITEDLMNRLTAAVPAYMIPTVFIPVLQLPITGTGKIDRKALQKLGVAEYQKYRMCENVVQQEEVLSSTEQIIKKVWMSVLNLSDTELGVTRSFTRLGGDSITAMQIVSQCKLHNIAFTVSDLLESATIRRLAARCSTVSSQDTTESSETEDDDGNNKHEPFHLSPIQQVFFETYPDGLNHWNQSFALELTRQVPPAHLQEALTAIVERHDMLRCRFLRDSDSGQWSQAITNKATQDCFTFMVHVVQDRARVSEIGQFRQKALDLQNGPIFACDLFDIIGENQVMILSCHHAVIDLVSWRIIWGDIEDYITTKSLQTLPTCSFRKWCRQQSRVGAQLSPLDVLPYAVPEPPVGFWGISDAENTSLNTTTLHQSFGKDTTALLFTDCNNLFNTEPIDIIVGALTHSFVSVFPERTIPIVWIEGHGREQPDGLSLDVTSTVGWFTTLHPRPVPITPADSLLHAIRLAKDRRKQIPHNGQPYFSCRFNNESKHNPFKSHGDPEILLNFVGQYQQLEGEEGLFRRADDVDFAEMAPSAVRSTMIEINAEVEEGQLATSFCFHQKMKHQDRLVQWADVFQQSMQTAAEQLQQSRVSFTLTDLPLLSLTYDTLDLLVSNELASLDIDTRNVVDIYPCTALQSGILLSTQRDKSLYSTSSVYKCIPNVGESICPQRLENAWRETVSRHTSLQTVFGLHPDGDSFIQILLSNVRPRTTIISCHDEVPSQVLERLEAPVFRANEPQHALFIAQSSNGEISMRLDASHSLIDASSIALLLQDICTIYDARPPDQTSPFCDLIRHIESTAKSQKLAAWEKLLSGVKPCIVRDTTTALPAPSPDAPICHDSVSLPTSVFDSVPQFCRDMGITKSVLLHVAWAMALSQFTGSSDVCFAYLVSGRDAPLQNVDAMVGPFANLLIGRVELKKPAAQVLAQVSSDSIQHMRIQHVSLAELQHRLGISGRMLNTAISLRGSEKQKNEKDASFRFEATEEDDPHEFDLDLTANVDGDVMHAAVSYRTGFISRQTAEAFAETLAEAVSCLVTSQTTVSDAAPDIPLFDHFFERSYGVRQSAIREYWQRQLLQVEAEPFPAIPQGYSPVLNSETLSSLPSINTTLSYKPATLMSAAWFILQSQMTGTQDCCFGVHNSFISSTLPVRFTLGKSITVGSLLDTIETEQDELALFQKTPLWFIQSISPDASQATSFRVILRESGSHEQAKQSHQSPALAIEYQNVHGALDFKIRYDDSVITGVQAQRLAALLQHLVHQLLQSSSHQHLVASLETLSQGDMDDIWSWNGTLPTAKPACLHTLISDMAHTQPDAHAVNGWDGNLTYQELDDLSSTLAAQLQERGVCKGLIVPLIFEKSIWTPVAALAVIKTGAAVVATDPTTQPRERLCTILAQTDARICLSSHSQASVAQAICQEVVLVGSDLISHSPSSFVPPNIHPDDLLYINFTSGSTGVPKGAMISHSNFASAIFYQRDVLGYFKEARVLDFASYAFDVWWSNLFNTLTVGGCLCTPSAEERQNELATIIEKYDVTLADITPTTARLIPDLGRLSSLLLGGEVVLGSDAALASSKTYVTNSYGPAECTPVSTAIDMALNEPGIGRGYGACTWIVDAEDPTKLAPIGAPGELWLEGPIVGLGYLADAEKTANSFVDGPVWLTSGSGHVPGRTGRLYRTGDLVRYSDTGSILFLGRKDTQVKLRGQRIELEEIEHAVCKALKTVTGSQPQVVAEVIERKDSGNKLLVTFVSLDSNPTGLSTDEYHDQRVKTATSGLQDKLKDLLPIYAVPSIFVPTRVIPLTPTNKVDRRKLRSMAAQLSSEEITLLSRVDGVTIEPRTDEETMLRKMWAQALRIDETSISVDDGFFRVGGDSIGAMKLVALARKKGITCLTVKDVFLHPVLQDMALLCI